MIYRAFTYPGIYIVATTAAEDTQGSGADAVCWFCTKIGHLNYLLVDVLKIVFDGLLGRTRRGDQEVILYRGLSDAVRNSRCIM